MTTELAQRSQLQNVRETRNIPFTDVELRAGADGKSLHFRGYASVTETPYEMEDMFGSYTEVVRAGAFKRTLAEGCDVGLVVNHEGIPLARTKPGTLTLLEDGKGLLADAASLDPASPLVQTVRSAMDRHDLDEMSMAFRVNGQEWSPDYMQRDILQINLHKGDVSIVNYGANPAANGATLRSLLRQDTRGLTFDAMTTAMRELVEVRVGAQLSAPTAATLKHLLSLVGSADTALDESQILLSELLGVANPDVAQDEALDRDAGDAGDDTQLNSLWLMELKNTIATRGLL